MNSCIKIVSGVVFAVAMFSAARAVAQPGPGTGYPYVKPGTNIIVNRDEFGGVKKELLFSKRLDKNLLEESDQKHSKLPAQFEVKYETENFESYENMQNCGDGWRLPTYREALLIGLLIDEMDMKKTFVFPVPFSTFWTATYFRAPESIYVFGFNSAGCVVSGTLHPRDGSKSSQRLCIRDIDTTSLGLSDL